MSRIAQCLLLAGAAVLLAAVALGVVGVAPATARADDAAAIVRPVDIDEDEGFGDEGFGDEDYGDEDYGDEGFTDGDIDDYAVPYYAPYYAPYYSYYPYGGYYYTPYYYPYYGSYPYYYYY